MLVNYKENWPPNYYSKFINIIQSSGTRFLDFPFVLEMNHTPDTHRKTWKSEDKIIKTPQARVLSLFAAIGQHGKHLIVIISRGYFYWIRTRVANNDENTFLDKRSLISRWHGILAPANSTSPEPANSWNDRSMRLSRSSCRKKVYRNLASTARSIYRSTVHYRVMHYKTYLRNKDGLVGWFSFGFHSVFIWFSFGFHWVSFGYMVFIGSMVRYLAASP